MIYGYARISSPRQNIERQIRNIKGVYPEAVVIQEVFTGTNYKDRKRLKGIGRPYKVGKEEYAAFYRAFMDFIELDEEKRYQELKNILVQIQSSLISSSIYESYIEEKGRLGQHIPMLYLNFSNGITGKECYDFMYDSPNRVDIGIFNSLDPTGAPNRIFINAIRHEGLEPLKLASMAARKANVPMMVHVGGNPPYLADMEPLFKKGDILTHVFNGRGGDVWNSDGTPSDALQKLINKGVWLDIGHGSSSFDFNIFEKALKYPLPPILMGTDLHQSSVKNLYGIWLLCFLKHMDAGCH